MANNRSIEIEELRNILDRIDSQISNCDNKAIAILGCLGVMLGILLATDFLKKIVSVFFYFINPLNVLHIPWIILIVISIIIIALGTYNLFSVLLGRIDPIIYKSTSLKTNSLLFWGSIASYKNYTDYLKKVVRADENVLKNDYISQIFISSKICQIKYKHYNKGLYQTCGGIVAYSVLIVIGVFMRKYGI